MKNKILPLFISIFLFGCTSTQIEYVDRVVEKKVPIVQPIHITIPEKPVSYVSKLKSTDTPITVAEAYYNTIILYENYIDSLLKILNTINENK